MRASLVLVEGFWTEYKMRLVGNPSFVGTLDRPSAGSASFLKCARPLSLLAPRSDRYDVLALHSAFVSAVTTANRQSCLHDLTVGLTIPWSGPVGLVGYEEAEPGESPIHGHTWHLTCCRSEDGELVRDALSRSVAKAIVGLVRTNKPAYQSIMSALRRSASTGPWCLHEAVMKAVAFAV